MMMMMTGQRINTTLTRLNNEREVGARLSITVLGAADVLSRVVSVHRTDLQYKLAELQPAAAAHVEQPAVVYATKYKHFGRFSVRYKRTTKHSFIHITRNHFHHLLPITIIHNSSNELQFKAKTQSLCGFSN